MTGCSDPEQAAISILQRPGARTQWCVIKLGPQGALIRTKQPPQTLHQSALQVRCPLFNPYTACWRAAGALHARSLHMSNVSDEVR